ncbi:ATP-binding protein [bacterium]
MIETHIEFTITLLNQLTEKARLKKLIQDFVRYHKLSENAKNDITLVLEEIFINIIKYVYCSSSKHYVDISLQEQDKKIFITVKDEGKVFNIFNTEEIHHPNFSQDNIKDISLSAVLIGTLIDAHSYKRKDKTNTLIINMTDSFDKETAVTRICKNTDLAWPEELSKNNTLNSLEDYKKYLNK